MRFHSVVLVSAVVVLFTHIAFPQGKGGGDGSSPAVIVTLGKPNVWTLDQAHYLLERNRAHDLGIAAVDPAPLDPNETVGYRIDAIKSLFSAQVQFDQSVGAKNAAATQQYQIDSARFNELRQQQDELRPKQAAAAAALASAQYEATLAKEKSDANPTDKQLKQESDDAQANVSRLTAVKAALDGEASSLATAVGSSAPSLSVTSSLPSDTGATTILGANSTFDKILGSIPGGLTQSKLGASIRLDNYINMQYEIVAKQLTLLRDEAGENNLVLFVELPQSIYATQKLKLYPDVEALWGNHLVQTWWQIDSIRTAVPPDPNESSDTSAGERPEEPPPPNTEQLHQLDELKKLNATNLQAVPKTDEKYGWYAALPGREKEDFQKWLTHWSFPTVSATNHSYALDLIPRQSALNVAEAHSVSHAYGFAGLFGLLSGFGGKARYERQHDQYDQFVQQEVFASAFGKGESQFGWTFGPLPGTKRLAPGLRTTYAVIVVPKNTRTLTLSGYGCAYRRRTVPENPFAFESGKGEDCGKEPVTFELEVPSDRESWWVDQVFYKPIAAGQRVTVEIDGDFTPQIGVLINGTPLQKVVSLGQPITEQASFNIPANEGSGVQGAFELVGGNTLMLSFAMPTGYVGTPRIALVSPTKAMEINDLPLERVNEAKATKDNPVRVSRSDTMFYQPTNIIRMAPEYCSQNCAAGSGGSESTTLQIFGWRFTPQSRRDSPTLLLNGKALTVVDAAATLGDNQFRIVNDSLIQARFNRKDAFPHWHVDLFEHYPNGEQVTFSRDDDGPMENLKCTVVDPKKAKAGDPQSLELSIGGDFLNPAFAPAGSKFTVTSANYDSAKGWDVVGSTTDPITAGAITFKGTASPTQLPLCKCGGIEKIASCGAAPSTTPPKPVKAKATPPPQAHKSHP